MKGTTTYKQESRRNVFTENLNGLKVLLDNTLPFEQKKSQELVKWGDEFQRESEEIVSSINVSDVDDVISLSKEIQCTLKYINDTINAASVEQLPTVRLAKDANNKLQAALQGIGCGTGSHTTESNSNRSTAGSSEEENMDYSEDAKPADDNCEYASVESIDAGEILEDKEKLLYEAFLGPVLKSYKQYTKEGTTEFHLNVTVKENNVWSFEIKFLKSSDGKTYVYLSTPGVVRIIREFASIEDMNKATMKFVDMYSCYVYGLDVDDSEDIAILDSFGLLKEGCSPDYSAFTERTDDKALKEEHSGLENDGTEENDHEEEHPIDQYEKYVGKELIDAAKNALDLYSKEHVSQYIMRSKYKNFWDVFYINVTEDGEKLKVKFTGYPALNYSYSVTVYSDDIEKGAKRIAFITIADIYGVEVSDEDYTKPAEEEPEDPISRKEKEGKALIEIEANIVNTLNAYVDFWKTTGDYRGKKDEARLTKKIEIAGSEWGFKFIFNNEADDGNQITIISENNSSVIMGSREDIGDAIEQLAEKILKDIYGDEAINDMYRLKRTLKQNDSETEIGERWDF